jgi:hypothetical protein
VAVLVTGCARPHTLPTIPVTALFTVGVDSLAALDTVSFAVEVAPLPAAPVVIPRALDRFGMAGYAAGGDGAKIRLLILERSRERFPTAFALPINRGNTIQAAIAANAMSLSPDTARGQGHRTEFVFFRIDEPGQRAPDSIVVHFVSGPVDTMLAVPTGAVAGKPRFTASSNSLKPMPSGVGDLYLEVRSAGPPPAAIPLLVYQRGDEWTPDVLKWNTKSRYHNFTYENVSAWRLYLFELPPEWR